MAEIPLANGGVTLVDDADADRVRAHRWVRQPNGYATTTIGNRTVYLHRYIDGTPPDRQVDHHNRDRLDNRRDNLRRCTRGQNQAATPKRPGGTSEYRGVSRKPVAAPRCWIAQIRIDNRSIHLGSFANEVEAAKAYDRAALAAFGEFATLNFPARNREEHAHA